MPEELWIGARKRGRRTWSRRGEQAGNGARGAPIDRGATGLRWALVIDPGGLRAWEVRWPQGRGVGAAGICGARARVARAPRWPGGAAVWGRRPAQATATVAEAGSGLYMFAQSGRGIGARSCREN